MYQSLEADRLASRHSNRSRSRFSVMSKISNYDDETISSANKRLANYLPKLNADRQDTNYLEQVARSLKQPSVSGGTNYKIRPSQYMEGTNTNSGHVP